MLEQQNKGIKDDGTVLAVAGVLCVSPAGSGQSIIRLGPSAGWMVPAGILRWERELSFVGRADMTPEFAKALRATLPHEQIASKRFAMAQRAVQASPLLPVGSELVEDARHQGVRVHTVGVDRVSSDFYYFAEGGNKPAVHVQGNLVEMLAPSVSASATNADIDALLEGLLDRLLSDLSEGEVSELEVELADRLPRLSRDATGLSGTDLERFEAQARLLAERCARFEPAARRLADVLAATAQDGPSSIRVPLYGEARHIAIAPLELSVMGKPLRLSARSQWVVTGAPREVEEPTRATPAPAAKAVAPTHAPAPAMIEPAKVPRPKSTPPASAPATTSTSASAPAPATVAPAPAPASAPAPAPATAPAPPTAPAPAPASAPARAAAPAPARLPRRSATVPTFLLLAFFMCLYFLWRSLP